MELVPTGVSQIDTALAGGIGAGTSLLLAGHEGAGATEFALGFLRHAASRGKRRARIVSALRSPTRIASELVTLFDDPSAAKPIEIVAIDADKLRANPTHVLDGLSNGDVLLIESADSLASPHDAISFTPCWRVIADEGADRGVVVMMLHSADTLPRPVEAAMEEAADGVLHFSWQQSGAARRRAFTIVKMRGLLPILEGADVPVFEVALQKGIGIIVSRGRSVL